jgi:preprotein translocase SecE subunit
LWESIAPFGRDSVREVKKVVWPARNEALQMTGYVFAFVFVMALFMWFEFTVHPPIWVHLVVTMPLLVLGCLGVLRPLKGGLVSEQVIHKAAQPVFESNGKHGEGSKWR